MMDFLKQLLAYRGMNFATPANAAVQQGGGGDGAGAGSGGGAPTGGGVGSGGVGQPAAQPGQGGGDGIAQLRTAYENVKKEFEPFQKLNLKPEQIQQYSGIYEKTYTQIASIGRQLGYPDNEIIEAMQEDPVATLDYLRNEFAQRQQGQQQQGRDPNANLQELVESRLQEALAPINERENARMTNEANAVFERTTYQMASEMYKQEGIDITSVPEDELSLLLSAASEILKYDEDALRALKYEGKTAPIQKAFTEAKTMLDKYFIARSQRSAGGGGRAPMGRAPNGQFQPGGQQGGKRPTLDEIINNPGVINQKYA